MIRLAEAWNRISGREAREKIAALQTEVASLQTRVKFNRKQTASGVPISGGGYDYEENIALEGSKKWKTLAKMVTDPHVKGGLRTNTIPLIKADWEIKPASEDARDVEIAEFVSANLLRTTGDKYGQEYWLQTSWRAQRLPEILKCLEHGFSMFNKTWRRVGTKVVYDRLQWLEPSSVDVRGWKLDAADNIEYVARTFSDAEDKYHFEQRLEPDNIALYPWDLVGARYEGTPFIRSQYGPWFRKDLVQKWATIWAQKTGAPIPIGHYPPKWDPSTISKFELFMRAMRGTAPAEAYGMFPTDADGNKAEAGYAESAHHEVDRSRGLLDGENRELAHGSMTTTSILGENATGGSRALGEAKGVVEMAMPEAIAVVVCEFESHGVGNIRGVIEDLVDANFGNVQAYPELVVSKINPFEGLENFDKILGAWEKGIIPKTPDSRRQVSERLGFNLPDDAYEIEVPVPPAFPPNVPTDDPRGGPVPPNGSNGEQGTEEQRMSLESVEQFRKRIAPMLQPKEDAPEAGGTFRRKPTQLESEVVSLAEVGRAFGEGQRDVLTVMRRGHREMIDELLQRFRDGKITTRNLNSQRKSNYTGRKALERDLGAEYRRVGEAGRGHVRSELERQEVA